MAKLETCANCQRAIGALETPQLFNDHVVCASCYSLLVAQRNSTAIAPSHTAIASPIDDASPAQQVQRVPPQVVYVVPRPAQTPEAAPAPVPAAVAQSSPVIHVHMPAQVLAQPAAPAQPAVAQPPIFHHTTQVHVSNNSTARPRIVVKSADGCLGSLFKLIGVVVVVGVVLVFLGIYFANPDHQRRSTSPAPATNPRAKSSAPNRNAAKAAPTSDRAPVSQSAMSASRRERIAAAENACLASLHQQPDYIAAKQSADELEAKVKAARADSQHAMLATLSQQWIDAKNKLAKMEADALAADPDVRAAKN